MTTTTATVPGASQAGTVMRGILARVLGTSADYAPTVARVALGLVMLPHGAQKLLGWKPVVPLEEGLAKTIAYFRDLLAGEGQ